MPSPGIVAGLTFDANHNTLFATTTDSHYLCSINPRTGVATIIGGLGVPLMFGLAYDNATGVLYGASNYSTYGGLYTINPVTGSATYVGSIGINVNGDAVVGLAFNPVTGVLYGSLSGPSHTGGLVTINTSTGQGTWVAGTQALTGLAFQPETGTLFGIDNGIGLYPDALYTINPANGQASLVGNTGLANDLGLVFVPEPGPGRFFLVALAAFWGHSRIRKLAGGASR